MHRKRPALPRPLLPAVGAAALALCLATPARAETGFNIATFQPSFAGDPFFGLQTPWASGEGQLHAMALLDYAHDPLVLRGAANNKSLGAIVSDQVLFHLDASYTLWKRLALNLDLPIAFQKGDQPSGGGYSFQAPSAAGLSDLRLGARIAIVGDDTDRFQLAVGSLLWMPTGTRSAYASDGALRGQPLLIAGGWTRRVIWSATLGPELRGTPTYPTVAPGAAMRWGAGVAFVPGENSFQIGPEFTGSVTLGDPQKRIADAQLLIGAKNRFARDFVVGFAAAFGLAPGVGTPDFRSVLSVSYSPDPNAPVPPPPDRDGDGIPDDADACPDERGKPSEDPKKHGCPVISDRDGDQIPDEEDACPDTPGIRDAARTINGCPPDRDNDQIPDSEDACPDQLGERSHDPKKHGCPPVVDRDGDQVPDDKDACPDTPGSPDPDPKKNGCPGDRDGDQILDDKDACPDEKGAPDPDPAKNGCPKDVRVTADQIVILQQVEFDINKATIRPVSNGLLDTVAQVFREHPEILKVEVGGHTDNTGSPEVNVTLSQARAAAVAAALVKRGIAGDRLTAKGYGPNRPIMANLTNQGRQKNRRVEFLILERRPKAEGKKP
jgi:outer membrane protein OmpA-like peptidoglycan-associated protein